MAVEKDYAFEGPDGKLSLPDLFEGRRQLIVYRAFYGPEVTTAAEGGAYPERACVGCSFVADQVAHPAHLNARDVTLAFVIARPQAEIQGLKERHGWEHIPWYTITDDFDKDFDVDEWHGTNAFIREATGSSAPTSSTAAATRPWAAPGATSTWPRLGARRSGRTLRRASRRRRRISGGTTTTRTATGDRPRRRRAAGGARALRGRRRRRLARGTRLDSFAAATPQEPPH